MDSQVGYHETDDSKSQSDMLKVAEIKLNNKELHLLQECNKESFYYRCLPFALIGMGATYYAVKTGYLPGHRKYGATFKMTGAAFAGWILGKFSYKGKCEEKFLTLENSSIGNAVRKKRGYVLRGSESETSQLSGYSEHYSQTPKDNNYTSYSSGDFHSSSRSLNFDKNEPSLELDDRERPNLDSDINLSDESQPVTQFTTYDELRRKNREEYEKQQYRQPEVPRSDMYRRPWNPTNSEPLRRTNFTPQEDTRKNTYGDAWDNPKFS